MPYFLPKSDKKKSVTDFLTFLRFFQGQQWRDWHAIASVEKSSFDVSTYWKRIWISPIQQIHD
jgi:hypothetical protein